MFPESIGGTLVYRDVCKPCNDRLGSSVDAPLIDHLAIQKFRAKYGLAGKTGRVPVPFSKGGVLNERGVKTPFTWDGEYMHRKPTERTTATGRELVVDPRDAPKIPGIEATLRKRGRSDTVVRVADEVMRGVITLPHNMDIRPAEPGLVKIVYEIACGVLGGPFLDEPSAVKIRDFLRDPGRGTDDSGFEAWFAGGQALFPMKGAREELLIGGLVRSRGRTVGHVRLFNVLDATIFVSDRAHPQVSDTGVAVVIDVTQPDAKPNFKSFASLGWKGQP